jgi:hypothetical protein
MQGLTLAQSESIISFVIKLLPRLKKWLASQKKLSGNFN